MKTSAEPRTTAALIVPLGFLYAFAMILGPFMSLYLWISAFGLFGSQPFDALAAIPALLALAVPPVIGIVLGWQAQVAQGSRVWIIAPAIPFVLVVLAYLVGLRPEFGASSVAWFGLVALYVFGPVLLGRFLRLAWTRVRSRPTSASPRGPTTRD